MVAEMPGYVTRGRSLVPPRPFGTVRDYHTLGSESIRQRGHDVVRRPLDVEDVASILDRAHDNTGARCHGFKTPAGVASAPELCPVVHTHGQDHSRWP